METLISIAMEYVSMGLVVLGCFYYIIQKDKSHEKEREGWETSIEKVIQAHTSQDKDQQDKLYSAIKRECRE